MPCQLQPAIAVEVIPGVSSYCASAARIAQPMVEADGRWRCYPLPAGVEVVDRMLDQFDSLVPAQDQADADELLDLLETTWYRPACGVCGKGRYP